jgi:hypothetical protein
MSLHMTSQSGGGDQCIVVAGLVFHTPSLLFLAFIHHMLRNLASVDTVKTGNIPGIRHEYTTYVCVISDTLEF